MPKEQQKDEVSHSSPNVVLLVDPPLVGLSDPNLDAPVLAFLMGGTQWHLSTPFVGSAFQRFNVSASKQPQKLF